MTQPTLYQRVAAAVAIAKSERDQHRMADILAEEARREMLTAATMADWVEADRKLRRADILRTA